MQVLCHVTAFSRMDKLMINIDIKEAIISDNAHKKAFWGGDIGVMASCSDEAGGNKARTKGRRF